jgi:hypothetical protein
MDRYFAELDRQFDQMERQASSSACMTSHLTFACWEPPAVSRACCSQACWPLSPAHLTPGMHTCLNPCVCAQMGQEFSQIFGDTNRMLMLERQKLREQQVRGERSESMNECGMSERQVFGVR